MTPTAIVLFLLPVALCLFIYVTAFIFYLHQRHPGRIWRRLRNTNLTEYNEVLDAGRDIVATLWDVQVGIQKTWLRSRSNLILFKLENDRISGS